MEDESSVGIYESHKFRVEANVYNGCDGKGVLYIQKDGETDPTALTSGNDGYEYDFEPKEFSDEETGTYKIWAEVTKEGYTRKSKVYTLHVGADLTKAEITLKQDSFTYTPSAGGAQEFTAEIESVSIAYPEKNVPLTVPDTAYTVSGNKGTNAGDGYTGYTLTITAINGSGYIGSKTADWSIKPLVLTDVAAWDYVKEYDGTKTVDADDIVKNKNMAPYLHYEGGSNNDSLTLEYGKDYDITDVSADFPDARKHRCVGVFFSNPHQSPCQSPKGD